MCKKCVRKAYRFYPWWAGVRHILIADGCAAADSDCDTCGEMIRKGEYILVFVLCEDSRVATHCHALLSGARDEQLVGASASATRPLESRRVDVDAK